MEQDCKDKIAHDNFPDLAEFLVFIGLYRDIDSDAEILKQAASENLATEWLWQ